MHLKTRLEKDPYRIKIIPPVQLVVMTMVNPALTGFTTSKSLWVRNHQPESCAKCRHILLPKGYMHYMLTGDYATDVFHASGMQLLGVHNRFWSAKMLDIDHALLAKVYESCEVTGYVSARAAALTGLSEDNLSHGRPHPALEHGLTGQALRA